MALAHLGLTFIKRVRCLCFDIKPVGGPKIQIADYMDFLIEDCKIDPSFIECQGYHSMTNHLMVTLTTEEVFKEKLALVEKGVPWTKKGGQVVFGFSAQEYLTSVTIQNWRPWMEVKPIIDQMATFGEVITWNTVKTPGFPGILQNQLKLRMKLKPGCVLPPDLGRSVSDIGERLSIFWEGSERRCFKCQGVGHSIAFCRQKAIDYDTTPSQNTWAVVASKKPANKNRQLPAAGITAKTSAATAGKTLPPAAVQSTSGKQPVQVSAGRPLPTMKDFVPPTFSQSQDQKEKKAAKIAAKAAKAAAKVAATAAAKAAQASQADQVVDQVAQDGQDGSQVVSTNGEVSKGPRQTFQSPARSDLESGEESDMETDMPLNQKGVNESRSLFLDSEGSPPNSPSPSGRQSRGISEHSSEFSSLPCNQQGLYPDAQSWTDEDLDLGRKRGLSLNGKVRNTKAKNK